MSISSIPSSTQAAHVPASAKSTRIEMEEATLEMVATLKQIAEHVKEVPELASSILAIVPIIERVPTTLYVFDPTTWMTQSIAKLYDDASVATCTLVARIHSHDYVEAAKLVATIHELAKTATLALRVAQ